MKPSLEDINNAMTKVRKNARGKGFDAPISSLFLILGQEEAEYVNGFAPPLEIFNVNIIRTIDKTRFEVLIKL